MIQDDTYLTDRDTLETREPETTIGITPFDINTEFTPDFIGTIDGDLTLISPNGTRRIVKPQPISLKSAPSISELPLNVTSSAGPNASELSSEELNISVNNNVSTNF